MIYAESLRHFCVEWIEIEHPKDTRNWPWDPSSGLFLINLYALPTSECLNVIPTPFVSILLDQVDALRDRLIGSDALYREFFNQDIISLPRRYLFDPLNAGNRNVHLNRYSFTSNTYGKNASDWTKGDLLLLRILGSRPHVRYSIYESEEYEILRRRLEQLGSASNSTIRYSENLLDATSLVENSNRFRQMSPETMIVAAPIVGVLKPIRKSKEYKVINGVLGMCTDDVQLAIPEEPSFQEYDKVRIPFQDFYRTQFHKASGEPNRAKAVVYTAVECAGGVFSFQEFTPNAIVEIKDEKYVRTINHLFTIQPELGSRDFGNAPTPQVRLRHKIEEGLIPYIKENQKFLKKHYEKLFYRSDMPNGIYKMPGGQIVSSLDVKGE